MGNGNKFQIQGTQPSTLNPLYISSVFAPNVIGGSFNLQDGNKVMAYNLSTLQVYNPATNLCLDDGGKEVNALCDKSNSLSFLPCNITSLNQQFVYVTASKTIQNINYPSLSVRVLNSDGNLYSGYQQVFLCSDYQAASSKWDVVLVCSPGTYTANLLDATCTQCPSGTFSSAQGATGSCSACAPGSFANSTGSTACVKCTAGTTPRTAHLSTLLTN
jgi:hypothetical protein